MAFVLPQLLSWLCIQHSLWVWLSHGRLLVLSTFVRGESSPVPMVCSLSRFPWQCCLSQQNSTMLEFHSTSTYKCSVWCFCASRALFFPSVHL